MSIIQRERAYSVNRQINILVNIIIGGGFAAPFCSAVLERTAEVIPALFYSAVLTDSGSDTRSLLFRRPDGQRK